MWNINLMAESKKQKKIVMKQVLTEHEYGDNYR
jgi:hypothetical protein